MSHCEVSQEALYTPVPVTQHGLKTDSSDSSANRAKLNSFLARSLPAKSLGDVKDLERKSFFLDAPQQKPKRCYNLKRNRRKTLTSREKKDLNLFKLDPKQARYELYLPLHELWKDYITDLIDCDKLTKKNRDQAEFRLLRADYHGACVQVIRAKNPSLVGITGIVLQESKNTFRLVTKEDKLKTIPKQNSVFTITVGDQLMTIFGNNFQYRASDRASRSFKARFSIDF